MAAENATAMSPPKAWDAGLLETNLMTVNTTAIPSEAIIAGHSAACELQLNATVSLLTAPTKMNPGRTVSRMPRTKPLAARTRCQAGISSLVRAPRLVLLRAEAI